MPKASLTFRLPEEEAEFHMAVKASNMHSVLWEVSQQIFRPARKHGYSDKAIQEALDKCSGHGEELISCLETRFWQLIEEYEVGSLA